MVRIDQSESRSVTRIRAFAARRARNKHARAKLLSADQESRLLDEYLDPHERPSYRALAKRHGLSVTTVARALHRAAQGK